MIAEIHVAGGAGKPRQGANALRESGFVVPHGWKGNPERKAELRGVGVKRGEYLVDRFEVLPAREGESAERRGEWRGKLAVALAEDDAGSQARVGK